LRIASAATRGRGNHRRRPRVSIFPRKSSTGGFLNAEYAARILGPRTLRRDVGRELLALRGATRRRAAPAKQLIVRALLSAGRKKSPLHLQVSNRVRNLSQVLASYVVDEWKNRCDFNYASHRTVPHETQDCCPNLTSLDSVLLLLLSTFLFDASAVFGSTPNSREVIFRCRDSRNSTLNSRFSPPPCSFPFSRFLLAPPFPSPSLKMRVFRSSLFS